MRVDVDDRAQRMAEVQRAHECNTFRARAPDRYLLTHESPTTRGSSQFRESIVALLAKFADQRGCRLEIVLLREPGSCRAVRRRCLDHQVLTVIHLVEALHVEA